MYTVNGASESYRFAVPQKNHEHLAYMSVSLAKEEVEFVMEDAGVGEGPVVYSAAVGEPGDGAKIMVGLFYLFSFFFRLRFCMLFGWIFYGLFVRFKVLCAAWTADGVFARFGVLHVGWLDRACVTHETATRKREWCEAFVARGWQVDGWVGASCDSVHFSRDDVAARFWCLCGALWEA